MAKTKKNSKPVIPDEIILSRIYLIREQKVMIDRDLAEMYGVETKALKQAVKRNIERFPGDFMFTLTRKEFQALRSQIVTSKEGRGGARYLPLAFTEQGVVPIAIGTVKHTEQCGRHSGEYSNHTHLQQNERTPSDTQRYFIKA